MPNKRIVMAKKVDDTGLKSEKLQCVAELGRTSAWIAKRYTDFLKPYGVSTQQLNILRVLRTADDWMAMHEVNNLMIIKSPNVTRLADKLVTKQLINRNRSEADRRIVYVQITDKALELLNEIDREHKGEVSDYLDSFTVEEAVLMTEILKRIRE